MTMPKKLTSLFLFLLLSQASISLAATSQELNDRLESCETRIAIAAAEEVTNDPAVLKNPLMLFAPAMVYFRHGKKDEAVFWYYAARLRMQYQIAASEENRGFLLLGLGLSMSELGTCINNYAFQNVLNFDRILDRVVAWDKNMPNPYPIRERTKWLSVNDNIQQLYAGLRAEYAKHAKENEKSMIEKGARLGLTAEAMRIAMEMRFQVEPVYPDFLDLKTKLDTEKRTLESNALLAAPVMELAFPKIFGCHRKLAQHVAPGDTPQAARP